MRKAWYDVKAAAGGKPATISIFDEIGMWGVTAKDFIASFRQIKENDVTLEINTPGGSVFDALAMFNAMRTSGKNITVKVMGIAASAGSYIAMVGNKIVMPENTFMMIHNPLNGIYGNAEDMREMADVLDKIGNSLTATYVARTGKSDAEVRALLANDTYMSAAECLELGFCDELTAAVTATAKFEREHLPANIQALFVAEETPDPVAEPAPEDEPAEVAPQATFADQVQVLATAADLADYAPVLVLDARMDSLDKVTARLAECREITALCAVAKAPEMAAKFINGGKTLIEARTALCDALVASDGMTSVDTTPGTDKQSQHASPTAGVTTAGVWAKRESVKSVKK